MKTFNKTYIQLKHIISESSYYNYNYEYDMYSVVQAIKRITHGFSTKVDKLGDKVRSYLVDQHQHIEKSHHYVDEQLINDALGYWTWMVNKFDSSYNRDAVKYLNSILRNKYGSGGSIPYNKVGLFSDIIFRSEYSKYKRKNRF